MDNRTTTLASAVFGRPRSARAPRQGQLGPPVFRLTCGSR
jgi:hypothetical protein